MVNKMEFLFAKEINQNSEIAIFPSISKFELKSKENMNFLICIKIPIKELELANQ